MRQTKVQIAWFYWVPKKSISRCVGYLARSRCRHLGCFLIFFYRRWFKVDLSEALHESPSDYVSLNDFFTRALKPDARPIAGGESVVISPCDGTLGQLGRLSGATLFSVSLIKPLVLRQQRPPACLMPEWHRLINQNDNWGTIAWQFLVHPQKQRRH